jgi:signal transduction histidine kinase
VRPRLSAQARKAVADIAKRRMHSLLVVAAITLAVGGLVAVTVADEGLSAAYAFTVSAQGTRPDVVVAVDKADDGLLADIRRPPNVAELQQATTLGTEWHVAAAPGHVSFTVISYPDLRSVPLTPFELLSGRYPGDGEIVMEFGDSALQPVRLGDVVTVDTADGSTAALRVVGIARTSGQNPAVTDKAVGYMSGSGLRLLPAYTYVPGQVPRHPLLAQELSIKLHDPARYQAAADAFGSVVRAYGGTVLAVFPPEQGVPVKQLQGVFSLVRVLLAVALLIAAILLVNTITALVTEQAPIIGTMKALGATRGPDRPWIPDHRRPLQRGGDTVGPGRRDRRRPDGHRPPGRGDSAGHRAVRAVARGHRARRGGRLRGTRHGRAGPAVAGYPHQRPRGAGRLGRRERGIDAGRPARPADRPARPCHPGTAHRVARAAGAIPQALARRAVDRDGVDSRDVIPGHAVHGHVGQRHDRRGLGQLRRRRRGLRRRAPLVPPGHRDALDRARPGPGGTGRLAGRCEYLGQARPLGGVEPDSAMYHHRLVSGRWFTAQDTDVVLVGDQLAARTGLHIGSTLPLTAPGSNEHVSWTVIGTVHESVDDLSQVGAAVVPVTQLYRFSGAPTQGLADFTDRIMVQSTDRSPAGVDRLTRAIDRVGRAAAAGRDGPIAEVFTFHDEVTRQQRNFTAAGLGLSHRLVRRLRAMAATVKVWSRGDLQPVVDTRGIDELSRLGAHLNEMAGQLRNLLTARREIAKLEERHRVQRELHDGVKQDLLAATLHLATARTALHDAPATLLGRLDRAHESTRRAQREITAIIEQLRPPPLAPLGLPDALATLCERFARQAGIPVETDLTAAVQLPADIEDALVRITQEALTNVSRHAHATRVTVALHAEADQVRLLVSDNGTGPPAATDATGLGLTSMREPAAAVGATFEIEDATPGTRIKVTVDG